MNNKFKAFMRIEDYEKSDKVFKIKGVASSTSIDSHGTIFSEKCQRGWIEDIEKGLPTYMESNHDGKFDFTKRIGKVTKAYTEKRSDGVSEFIIEAELNMENASAKEVVRIMENPNIEMGEPEVLGLSINGYVEDFRFETINDEIIEIYDKARLEMVGIVEYPSNPDSINVSLLRSIDEEEKKKAFSRIMNKEKQKIEEKQLKERIDNNISKGKEQMSEEKKVNDVVETTESVERVEVESKEVESVERVEAELISQEPKETNVNVTVNSSSTESSDISRQIEEMTKGFADALKSVTETVSELRSEIKNEVKEAHKKVEEANLKTEEVKAELQRAKETPVTKPAQVVVEETPELETKITRKEIVDYINDPNTPYEKKALLKAKLLRHWYHNA